MTEYGIYYPPAITGKQLDAYLAKGWYRMGQGIFTTNYVIQEERFLRVYWLRYNLRNIRFGKSAEQIQKINRAFSVCLKPLCITTELETLYSLYKSSIAFEPAESVQGWLYDKRSINIFDTHIIEVRDNGLLIAAGIFDNGNNAIAGILNFYHPDYKKKSLGKYLMLLKIKYAIAEGILWYYPGYIVKDFSKFDYKLFVDKAAAEIFIPEKNGWYAYNKNRMIYPGI